MNLLFFVHQFFPEFKSGTEKVTLSLAKAAQRAGHKVTVLACANNLEHFDCWPSGRLVGGYESVYAGLPLMLLPRNQLPATSAFSFDSNPGMVRRLRQWLGEEKFDLAHGTHPMHMASLLDGLLEAGVPYILTLTDFFYCCYRINLINAHGQACEGPAEGGRCLTDCPIFADDGDRFKNRHQRAHRFLQHARERVAPSEFVADRYRTVFPELNFRVIPHGVELIRLAEKKSFAKNVESASSPLKLLYLGTLVEQKGVAVLLDALAKIPTANISLRIAGGFYGNSAYESEISARVSKDPRVELIGEIGAEDVAKELAAADVLCLPSLVPETFSLVLSEAAVAGVPAMVSDLGAQEGFVRKSGAGRVIKSGDVTAWAEALGGLAGHRELLGDWRRRVPLPLRQEEEAFLYQSLYQFAA